MAGDWIAISKGLSRKREIIQIASVTLLSRFECVGWMIELWTWADEETDDGLLPGVFIKQLPEILGNTETFWQTVAAVGWLKESPNGIELPNFDRWMGKSAKSRMKSLLRQRLSRLKRDKNVTTEQNSTEENKDSPNGESSAEPAEPAAAATTVLTFPCSGKGAKEWSLTQTKLVEYAESFPAVDVLAECRKALQWCRDNPRNRKTAVGMAAFLTRWLGKAQDSAPRTNAPPGEANGHTGNGFRPVGGRVYPSAEKRSQYDRIGTRISTVPTGPAAHGESLAPDAQATPPGRHSAPAAPGDPGGGDG